MARIYRVATPADLPALQALAKSAHIKLVHPPSAGFVCEVDGVIQAAIGCDWSNERYVIVGPLIVAPGVRDGRWMILRLVEHLEAFLLQAGVSRYICSTAVSNRRWNRIMEHVGCERYTTRNGRHWYLRRIGTYGQA